MARSGDEGTHEIEVEGVPTHSSTLEEKEVTASLVRRLTQVCHHLIVLIPSPQSAPHRAHHAEVLQNSTKQSAT